jgi:hypothetical protein
VHVGNAMGREILYERSRDEMKVDPARAAGFRDFNCQRQRPARHAVLCMRAATARSRSPYFLRKAIRPFMYVS